MDRVCDELDEARAEMEKLREECRAKTELSESLRKAHTQQLAKVKEAKLEIERQAQEINAKSEEISELRQLYEDLKSDLQRKDSFLQHLSSAHDRFRVDFGEKMSKLEGENRDTVLALDDARAKIQDLERQVCASNEEINGLKRLLSVKRNKCHEDEQAKQALRERDDIILKLEEENRIVRDQLKWKSEQFKHLEEAHEKLQDQFQKSKVDSVQEKSALLEEISSLQSSLDSQTRISESFQTQLKMCNQALAHEESRRKVLEIESCEFRSRYENVFSECEEAKSKIENLTLKRDEEIAELRNLVREQEMLCKEMKYRTAHLEQENQELRGSLKELQEAQLNDAAATSSMRKLKNKLNGLEQLHSKCFINLKEKEAEWSSQMEKLTNHLRCSISELKDKDEQIKELRKELESCHCSTEAQNEEISVLITVFKSELDVAYSKFFSAKAKLVSWDEESRKKSSLLTEQLDLRNRELSEVHADLLQRCEEKAALMERIDSLDSTKEKQDFLEEEVKRYKEMLDESTENKFCLEKQLLQMENALEEQRVDASNDLQKVKLELANKTLEIKATEIELQKLRSVAENLKLKLEENQKANSHEKKDLLGIISGQETEIINLRDQITSLELTIVTKTEAVEALKLENEGYVQIAQDRTISIENLQNEIAQLKQAERELENMKFARLEAQKAFEDEKEGLLTIINGKNERMKCLEEEAKLLDKNFTNAVASFTEKENMFKEALERVEEKQFLEMEDKNKIIRELEMEVDDLNRKLESQGVSFKHSEDEVKQLKALLQEHESEAEDLKIQFQDELLRLENIMEELKSHNEALQVDINKLSADKEGLLLQMEGVFKRLSELCGKDVELSTMLERIVPYSENKPALNHMGEIFVEVPFPLSRKETEESIDERVPLTELNC